MGLSALMYSISNKNAIDCTRILTSYCPQNIFDVDRSGNDNLKLAAIYNNHLAADLLIRKGIHPLNQNYSNENALDVAKKNNSFKTERFIISYLYKNGLYSKHSTKRFILSSKYKDYFTMAVFGLWAYFSIKCLVFTQLVFNAIVLVSFTYLIYKFFIIMKNENSLSNMFNGLSIAIAIYVTTRYFSGWDSIYSKFLIFYPSIHLYLYYILLKKDPGIIIVSQEEKFNFIKNLKYNIKEKNIDRICTTCLIDRPLRSKHCDACEKCIYRFDHHCYWINKCVGLKNNGLFIFILFGVVSSGIVWILALTNYTRSLVSKDLMNMKVIIDLIIFYPSELVSIVVSYFVELLFVMFLLRFLYVNIRYGITTNEYWKMDKYDYLYNNPRNFKEPKYIKYNHGIFRNIVNYLKLLILQISEY